MHQVPDHSHGDGYDVEPVRSLMVPHPASPEQATPVDLEGLIPFGASDSVQHGDNENRVNRQRDNLDLSYRLLRVLSPPGTEPPTLEDLQWPGKLMPFQEDGVRALMGSDRLLLADDMGLGKTLQVIAAFRILRHRGDIRSALVAAPASLLDQWRGELRKWAPELSAIIIRGSASDRGWQWQAETDVTLVSYETLRSDFEGNAHAPVRRKIWDVVVADEAQRIKNRNDTSRSLKGLKRVRSWALTGTPIENHEEELASILEFVDHTTRMDSQSVTNPAPNCSAATDSFSCAARRATSWKTCRKSRLHCCQLGFTPRRGPATTKPNKKGLFTSGRWERTSPSGTCWN